MVSHGERRTNPVPFRIAGPAPRRFALAAALLASSSTFALADGCSGSICSVTVGSDPGTSSDGTTGGPGTLSYALAYANAQSGPVTINIQQGLIISLGGPLTPIFNSVTINGNGSTISGNNATRIFMVGVDTATQTSAAVAGSIIALPQNVAINNVTLANGLAQGGNGGGSGGGGLGAGGAIFVNQSATVTLSSVSFANNKSRGGASGISSGSIFGGGGGGLGGNGSPLGGGGGIFGGSTGTGGAGLFGTTSGSGGGGYTGAGGAGVAYGAGGAGAAGKLSISGLSGGGGAGGGSFSAALPGGAIGGGGGGGAGSYGFLGGGGGFGGGSAVGSFNYLAGNGGFGGGGGGSPFGTSAGVGGYGGGGGAGGGSVGGFGGGGGGFYGVGGFGGGGSGGTQGLNGGFGAGGGGGSQGFSIGQGGFGGGNGSGQSLFGGPGGGGGAMGGAVFVVSGGTLIINGDGSSSGGSVTGGLGGGSTPTGSYTPTGGGGGGGLLTNGQAGSNNGSAYGSGFFVEGSPLTFGSGNYTISDNIADLNGSAGNTTTPDGVGGTGGQTSITKNGSGTLVLSGANTYSGPTTVSGGGTLEVDGSIASNVMVSAQGGLTGVGAVGATSVAANGVLAPGSVTASGSSLTISGNLTLSANSVYLIALGAKSSTYANVLGSASLGGQILAGLSSPGAPARQYTILRSSDGFGGTTFAGVTPVASLANFKIALAYDPDSVVMNLSANLGGAAPLPGNAGQVGAAINAAYNSGVSLPAGLANLFTTDGAALANGLASASGEAATGAAPSALRAADLFLLAMLDPFARSPNGELGGGPAPALAFAPSALSSTAAAAIGAATLPTPKWAVWGSAYNSYGALAGDASGAGSHDLASHVGGAAIGADYRLSRDTTLGLALGTGALSWSLAQGLGGGQGPFLQGGLYGSTHWGPAYVSGAVAASNAWLSTSRLAFGDTLTGAFTAQTLSARLEGGYRFATPWLGLTPYAALQPRRATTSSFAESDPAGGGFALNYGAGALNDVRAEWGAKLDRSYAQATGATLNLRGQLAWAHDWTSGSSLAAQFLTTPGVGFTTLGAAPTRDAALVSGSAEWALTGGVSFWAKFDGELASREQVYVGGAGLKYVW